nr:muscle M-line assembly protein unc-89-like [Megalopta genalis]
MPTQYCFLCASDEGVFVDITTENIQKFRTQFEICSLVKVSISNKSQTKICHKCVYELNQCSTFLQNYKKSLKQQPQDWRPYCSLCFQMPKNEYIFYLSKEDSLQFKSIEKIRQVVNVEAGKIQLDIVLVCLSCRYTVDVLFDLKSLSNQIGSILDKKTEKDIDYSRFPKVKTTVISRKTTITESEKATLKSRENTNGDSNMKIYTRSKAKVQDNRVNNKAVAISDEQLCVECHNPVKSNSDSRVNERTGQKSVCNDCWESNRSNAKDTEVHQSSTETKVCKVFLKDVLGQTATQKGKKMNEVEKDNQNKKKPGPKAMPKEFRDILRDSDSSVVKLSQKRSSKSANIDDTDNSDVPSKRQKRGSKGSLSDQDVRISSRKTRKRKGTGQKSDSDYLVNSNNVKESNKGSPSKHKTIVISSASDAEIEIRVPNRCARKGLRSILAEKNTSKDTDDGPSKKKKLRFTNDPLMIIDLTNTSDEGGRPKRNVARRTADKGEKIVKSALAKKSSGKTESSESESKDSSVEEEIETYSCEECGVNYENKVVFLTHRLSHYKQPKLELQKLKIDNKSKEVSVGASEAADEQSEDQSEGIRITVDDDDEEETELEANNLENNAETSSRAEKTAASPGEEAPKDTVDTEVRFKESDNDQPTEKDGKDKESIQGRASRSPSGNDDKTNDENVSEQVEEEDVEDISLTNLEDDQEEEKEVGEGAEKEEIEGKEKEAESENTMVDAVDEAEPKVTISEEKSEEDVHKDDDVDKLDSSEKLEANANQEKDKPDEDESNEKDESKEKSDVESSEKSEENPVEGKEDLNSFDTPEEKIEEKNKSVEISRDSSDESEENVIEKETAESSDKPAEEKVRRKSRKIEKAEIEKAEGTNKLDSSEKSQGATGSPSRTSPRRSKSSSLGKLEENKRDNSESSEEKDKVTSSPERRSTRKSKTVLHSKIEENKKSEEGKEKAAGSPDNLGKSPERKSPRRSKSVLSATTEENKKDSAEKYEEKDESSKPEEKKVTRKSNKSVSFTKSEGKDKQEAPEKPEEKSESVEKREDQLDSAEKSESEPDASEKPEDRSDSSKKLEVNESKGEKVVEAEADVVVEINEDSSSDDVMEVSEKEPDHRPSVNDTEEVLDSNDENSSDVVEICERKDEVECIEETNPPDETDRSASSGAEKSDQDIAAVPASDSADVAAEILQEVLDLASAEIQKRQDVTEVADGNDSDDAETLENISREVQNGGDANSRESHARFSTIDPS